MQTAREFYGKNYDLAPNQTKLDEAHKWLVKGCEFEAEAIAKGESIPAKMALKTACKRELEGYGLPA